MRERSRSPEIKSPSKKLSKNSFNYSSNLNQINQSSSTLTYLQSKNLKRDLCKYYLNGSCTKGDKCTYSHVLKDFPCKFFNSRGFCDNKEKCK